METSKIVLETKKSDFGTAWIVSVDGSAIWCGLTPDAALAGVNRKTLKNAEVLYMIDDETVLEAGEVIHETLIRPARA